MRLDVSCLLWFGLRRMVDCSCALCAVRCWVMFALLLVVCGLFFRVSSLLCVVCCLVFVVCCVWLLGGCWSCGLVVVRCVLFVAC